MLDFECVMLVFRFLNDMAMNFETAIIVINHDEKIMTAFKRTYHIIHEEEGKGRRFD